MDDDPVGFNRGVDCRSGNLKYQHLAIACFSFLFAFGVAYTIYKSVNHYLNADDDGSRPSKTLFIIGTLFNSASLLSLFLLGFIAVRASLSCDHHVVSTMFAGDIIYWLFCILYAFQTVFLQLLWLRRLRIVFDGSVYAIRNCTYFSYLTLSVLLFSATVVFFRLLPLIMEIVLHFLSIVLLAVLTYVYILKLTRLMVHSQHSFSVDDVDNEHNADPEIITHIVQCILLQAISICCVLLTSLGMIVFGSVRRLQYPLELIFCYFLLDVVMNFVGTMLTYAYFSDLYTKLCLGLHATTGAWYISAVVKMREDEQQPPLQQNVKTVSHRGLKDLQAAEVEDADHGQKPSDNDEQKNTKHSDYTDQSGNEPMTESTTVSTEEKATVVEISKDSKKSVSKPDSKEEESAEKEAPPFLILRQLTMASVVIRPRNFTATGVSRKASMSDQKQISRTDTLSVQQSTTKSIFTSSSRKSALSSSHSRTSTLYRSSIIKWNGAGNMSLTQSEAEIVREKPNMMQLQLGLSTGLGSVQEGDETEWSTDSHEEPHMNVQISREPQMNGQLSAEPQMNVQRSTEPELNGQISTASVKL
mmetsp:Transcript_24418/g.38658  ORF Transcript_24418/g.38658 Transcript_24418/m.38658 type:complete len:586 (+) Transcript_24418:17-1774(+)